MEIYIYYANGSEELYDQETDPKNFNNLLFHQNQSEALANQEKYNSIKNELVKSLPTFNALDQPISNYDKKEK
jgi:hypothetical protein